MNITDIRYFDETRQTIEAVVDGKTYYVPVDPSNRYYRRIIELGLVVEPYVAPVPPAVDELVEKAAQEFLEQDLKVKALGLVLADVIERSFGVSKQVARQEVVNRFKTYYKTLLANQQQ